MKGAIEKCKGCGVAVSLPMSSWSLQAYRLHGAKLDKNLKITPDQRDFIETGLCPDCPYESEGVTVQYLDELEMGSAA